MPFAETTDRARIHYEVRGTGSVNLIFLHGNGGPDGRLWDEVIAQLDTSRFRSIALDYRGFGKSDCVADGYNWKTFGEDILAVANHVGAKRFVPVGFSFGGKLACYMAAKYPERIPAQALVAPVGPGTVSLERNAGLQICRDASDWIRVRPFFRNLWFGLAANEELVDACCQATARIPQSVLIATVEMALWTSLADEIGKLGMPTLVVTGSEDPAYGIRYQEEETLPFLDRFEVATLASGHFVPLEQPVASANLISKFLAGISN